jgi:hypothetical protein
MLVSPKKKVKKWLPIVLVTLNFFELFCLIWRLLYIQLRCQSRRGLGIDAAQGSMCCRHLENIDTHLVVCSFHFQPCSFRACEEYRGYEVLSCNFLRTVRCAITTCQSAAWAFPNSTVFIAIKRHEYGCCSTFRSSFWEWPQGKEF